MATEYSGRGEARRSLELLWGIRRRAKRGPKPGLSVERVIATAVAVADRDGLGALSMRRVADELGVGTMSIYTYVPAKAELVDLMLDTVFGEQLAALEGLLEGGGDHGRPAGLGWRAGLEARARIDWDLCMRHPWLAQVASSRAVLGPNETAVLDRSLRLVDGVGLTAREMVATLDALSLFVTSGARRAVEIKEAPTQTGMTDDEWWLERAPLMEEFYDWTRFPTVIAVSEAGGFDEPDGTSSYLLQFLIDDFEFGLQRLLDGVEALLESRSAPSESGRPG